MLRSPSYSTRQPLGADRCHTQLTTINQFVASHRCHHGNLTVGAFSVFSLMVLSLALFPFRLAAQTTLYWDGDGAGTVAGGTGTWNTSLARWDSSATGSSYHEWVNNDIAVFGHTAGTVTLDTDVTAHSLKFDASGYRIEGSGTLYLSGGIDANSHNVTIAAAISSTTGLTKSGTGTLTLAGANTYAGGTAVHAGSLTVGSGGSITHPTENLTVTAGSYDPTPVLQIAGGGAVSNATGYLGYAEYDTGSAEVAGTWTNSGELHVGYFGTGTLQVQAGGNVSNTTGYVGSQITRESHPYQLDDSYVASKGTVEIAGTWTNSDSLYVGYNGTGTLRILAGGLVSNTTGYVAYAPYYLIMDGGASTGCGEVEVAGTWTNSTGLVIGVEGFATVKLYAGGIINVDAGTGTVQLGQRYDAIGTLTIGGSSGAAGVLNAAEVAGGYGTAQLNFEHEASGYYFTSDGTATGSAIAITGSTSVNHRGTGTTVLTGANTYAGATTISDGTLAIGSTGSITQVNTDLRIGEGSGHHGTLRIDAGGSASTRNGYVAKESDDSGTADVSGTWSNSEYIHIGYGGTGTLTIRSGGAVTNAAGIIGYAGESSDIWGPIPGSSGTANVAGTWTNTESLQVGLGGTGLLTIQAGGRVNVKAGAGTTTLGTDTGSSGTLNVGSGSAAGILNAATVHGGAGSATLNFNHNDTAYNFTKDGTASGNAITITGSTKVNQIGPGTTILSGANTYTGATTISAGTLDLAGSAIHSAFTVDGGKLMGTGTTGALTISGGGTLSPGNSPGTLTVGNTTFASGGTYLWEINDAAGTADTNWDFLNITGTLTITATTADPFIIAITSLTADNEAGALANFDPAADYTYTIATASGGITGFNANAFSLTTTDFSNAYTGAWSIAVVGNNLNLAYTATAVPEPATCVTLFGSVVLAFAVWWHRRGRLGP